MAKKRVEVRIPAGGGRPPWTRVAAFASVGLVVGVAWPSLAGLRIGPEVPGNEKKSAPAAETTAAPTAASTNAPSAKAPTADEPATKISTTQRVVVGGGDVTRCYKGKDKIEGDCGRIKLDKVFVHRLEELKGCPAALGLEGQLEVRLDLSFEKKSISVRQGKKGELPGSTVNGVMRCVRDYIADVDASRIPHKHSRYWVEYTLEFFPPGSALPTEGTTDAPEGESDSQRGVAAVTWDSVLVRDEPVNGKRVARLVRGTRVKILGRRKDWYRVKLRDKEGWVYRGALGR